MEHHTVHVRWIKAHVGHEGHEKVDELAKSGALGQGTRMAMPAPWGSAMSAIEDSTRKGVE